MQSAQHELDKLAGDLVEKGAQVVQQAKALSAKPSNHDQATAAETAAASSELRSNMQSQGLLSSVSGRQAASTQQERKPTKSKRQTKLLKFATNRPKRQIFLNLVSQRQLKAINEDENTEKGDFASPRSSLFTTQKRASIGFPDSHSLATQALGSRASPRAPSP